jgi:hypothetical protein
LNFSRLCAIPLQICVRLRVRGENANWAVCAIRAELRSSTVRICPKTICHRTTPFFIRVATSYPNQIGIRTDCPSTECYPTGRKNLEGLDNSEPPRLKR